MEQMINYPEARVLQSIAEQAPFPPHTEIPPPKKGGGVLAKYGCIAMMQKVALQLAGDTVLLPTVHLATMLHWFQVD